MGWRMFLQQGVDRRCAVQAILWCHLQFNSNPSVVSLAMHKEDDHKITGVPEVLYLDKQVARMVPRDFVY